jgi:dienelactone hydrolase
LWSDRQTTDGFRDARDRTTIDGTSGYLARPAAEWTYPAVVLVHEWWGLNETIDHLTESRSGTATSCSRSTATTG